MFTVADVADLLAVRAYKRGWRLSVYEGQTRREPMLRIEATVDDAYNPGQDTPLDILSPIPDFALESELAFDKWLAWRLGEIERHEVYEWFRKRRRDGSGWVAVFNPHREGADRDEWPIIKRMPFSPDGYADSQRPAE